MPSGKTSGRLTLSRSRRLSIDVLHYNRRMPLCAHDRCFDLGRLAEVRSRLPHRVSWSLLFVKAFALVAARHPSLRQAYLEWPWPHVYQFAQSVASVATHRDIDGEPWLFWSRFAQPDTQPLVQLQQMLDRYRAEPPARIFRQQWRLSAFPTGIRRWIWWWTLNCAGAKRAKRVGTFFLTTLAGKGVEIQDPPAFLTCNLTYGPLDHNGHCKVTISYDHRLMDGLFIADRLIELEQALNGEILRELEEIIAAADRTAA